MRLAFDWGKHGCKVGHVFFLRFEDAEVICVCLVCAGRISRSKLISWSLPWKAAGYHNLGPGKIGKVGFFLAAHRFLGYYSFTTRIIWEMVG